MTANDLTQRTTIVTTPGDTSTIEQTAQRENEDRLRHILAIPFEHCPWPPVRVALIQRALSGAPIKVYAWYSATVWMIEDGTYGDTTLRSPREWAIKEGYIYLDEPVDAVDAVDGKEGA